MAGQAKPAGLYVRESAGLEFDRVSFFSDAIYAIAMTLLVVELHLPEGAVLRTPGEMLAAISATGPQIFGFFLGFVVLGRYWMAHHEFFASLRSLDQRLMAINLVYLSIVAFSPFPVSLISDYQANPASFMLFAVSMAAISGLETVMIHRAARHGHLRRPMSERGLRRALILSGTPVLFMLGSLPLGLINPGMAFLSWLLMYPLGAWMARRLPDPDQAAPEVALDPGRDPD